MPFNSGVALRLRFDVYLRVPGDLQWQTTRYEPTILGLEGRSPQRWERIQKMGQTMQQTTSDIKKMKKQDHNQSASGSRSISKVDKDVNHLKNKVEDIEHLYKELSADVLDVREKNGQLGAD